MCTTSSDFVAELGIPFLAHRLRRLSELFVDDYACWLPEVGVTAPPRSLSTLLLLGELKDAGVTELATKLRLTHPLMIKMVAALAKVGFVTLHSDPQDGRRRPVRLTRKGEAEIERIEFAIRIMTAAYNELFRETGASLMDDVIRVEEAQLRDPFRCRLTRLAAYA
jgi:DNA-binding MarR family transcriptional regulator